MKIVVKRLIAISLTAIMLLSVLTSCKTSSGNQNNNSATTDNSNQTGAQNATAQETTLLYPDLPAQDFGGYNFRFLTRSWKDQVDWGEWDHRDISATEENGDVINDAVFARNKKIEDKYNITISETPVEDFAGTFRKMVKAGDDSYDVVCPHIIEFASYAQEGDFVDLFTVPNMDLTKPWWNQGCTRDLSVMHKQFVMQGDLLIIDNDAMEAMIFNKSLLQQNALESPYDIVKRGDWTFDKLIEMSKGVSKDLNGDGQMYILDDRFGCILQADTDISFIVSGGEKICAKDANDIPIITYGSDRCYSIENKMSEMALDENDFINLHRYAGKFGIYDEQVQMFSEDRALFSWIRMRIVERLRGMDTDFGIIPLPKLDSAQTNYITHMNPHTGAGISIPVTNSDLARTGTILEDLSAESRYTLQPAYYDVNLRGKFARDEESQGMLDIILNNTAYDIGYIYNFGNFAMTIVYYGRDKKTDYASAFEKMQAKMQTDIDKTVAAYEKLG
ncbi:MAG: extracellular solute-binding protein [Oscillospiraceae bacterium]|nr:extracellular solute-binding protein [Oscillospiraceae bacterium]